MMPQVIPSAEAFFFPGKPAKAGCLLVHGFTGTPKEMRGLGKFLSENGYNALGVRLAGHATRPEDMIRSRWTDWVASVEDGYAQLRGVTSTVFFIGLSMGGALSLLMSTRLEAAGVVAMSTPYRMPTDYPAWMFKLLSSILPYKQKSKGHPDSGWFDKAAYADHVSYPKNPVRSAAELNSLLAEVHKAIPQVRVPVLLIHSRNDPYIVPENMDKISAGLANAPDKKITWVEGSGHVLTRDAARAEVFKATLDFIRKWSPDN